MAFLRIYLAKIFAALVVNRIRYWAKFPIKTQNKVFEKLIKTASKTKFGEKHKFVTIRNYKDFVENVPIRDYEGLRFYFDKVSAGQSDILWPGKPLYLAKTSGTTSGTKYIPITKQSIKAQISASRNAVLSYIHDTGKAKFVAGKWIFVQGSPVLTETNGIKTGRLSGISAHFVPSYLQRSRMPSWGVNCIEDWETKIEKIAEETINEDMTIIAGIPSWVQMYFEKLINIKGTTVSEIFPRFNLLIFGGVNFEPYRVKFERLIGKKIDCIELYPASEGFFAFQDLQDSRGMLLQLDSGIFYEFVSVDTFFKEDQHRIPLSEVKLGVNYVMVISTNAGLWAYNIGDTVEFTSLNPYRIIVTGRIKHFISSFGEHVIAKEVESAITVALVNENARINEFTVAPFVNPAKGLPHHEWLIEFDSLPVNIDLFSKKIDNEMQNQNIYYKDLISGKILKPLSISVVKKDGFMKYMRSIGKLGGQNKTPRLSNDRKIANYLHNNNLVK